MPFLLLCVLRSDPYEIELMSAGDERPLAHTERYFICPDASFSILSVEQMRICSYDNILMVMQLRDPSHTICVCVCVLYVSFNGMIITNEEDSRRREST